MTISKPYSYSDFMKSPIRMLNFQGQSATADGMYDHEHVHQTVGKKSADSAVR